MSAFGFSQVQPRMQKFPWFQCQTLGAKHVSKPLVRSICLEMFDYQPMILSKYETHFGAKKISHDS